MFSQSCLLTTDTQLTFAEARATTGWRCPAPAAAAERPFAWIALPPGKLKSGERMSLQIDGQPMAGVTTVVALPDGTIRSRFYDAEALAARRGPASTLMLSLYGADEAPTGAWLEIQRPFARGPATLFALHPTAQLYREKEYSTALFGILTGMMLLASFYSIMMYFALVRMFTLYHAVLSAMLGLYTFASSSLQLLLFPHSGLWERTITSYAALSLAMAATGAFLVSFLEEGALSRPVRWAMILGAGLLVVNAAFFACFAPRMPFVARTIYHLAYVPAALACVAVWIDAWRRGSRMIRLVVCCWIIPFAIAVERLLRGLHFYNLPARADYAFYVAIAFESVVTALLVAWRVSDLRRERDVALEQSRLMSSLAATDGLTGLANRRDFDVAAWPEGSYLAVIDLDHFKTINDRFGHLVGDDVLRAVAFTLLESVAAGRIGAVWRLGGEEFALRLSAPSIEAAATALNHLRHLITERVHADVPALREPLTVSAGLAPVLGGARQAAYVAADRALYQAKTAGRDRLSYETAERAVATLHSVTGSRAVA